MWAAPSSPKVAESCGGVEFDWAAKEGASAIAATRGSAGIFIVTFVPEGQVEAKLNHRGHRDPQRILTPSVKLCELCG
jgi:hypothetical protein